MPRGREPEGEAPLSNAERQARYRVRHKEKQASVIVRPLRPVDRRSRLQRWHAAPASAPSANASAGAGSAELVDLQAGYAAWLDACRSRSGALRPRRRFRRSSIWTSKSWPQSSRRAVTAATDT
jgi:hypothetical protein